MPTRRVDASQDPSRSSRWVLRFRLAAALITAVVASAGAVAATAPASAAAPAIAVGASVNAGSAPTDIIASPTGEVMYVLSDMDQVVFAIDTSTGTSTVFPYAPYTGNAMLLSPDGEQLFVLDTSNRTVIVIDVDTGITAYVGVEAAETMQISPDGSRLYVAGRTSQAITVIDTAASQAIRTEWMWEPVNVLGISPDGARLYFGLAGAVWAMSTVDFSMTLILNAPDVSQVVLSANGALMYALDSTQTVWSVDTATGVIAFNATPLDATSGIALSADGAELFLLGPYGSSQSRLEILSASMGTMRDVVWLPGAASEMAVDSDGSVVWISTDLGVSVVEPATATVESVLLSFAYAGIGLVPGEGRGYALSTGGREARELTLIRPRIVPARQTVAAVFGQPIAPTQALTTEYFTGAVAFTVQPALPAGLVLDPGTGVVSGTPSGSGHGPIEYVVTGSDGAGGEDTAVLTISVAVTVPGAPVGAVAVAGARQAYVNWSPPSNLGGPGPVSYTVTASPGGASCATSSTSCAVTGLTAGETYTFAVTATTPQGTSAAASTAGVLVAGIATPVTPPAATSGTTLRLVTADGATVTTIQPGQQLFVETAGFAPGSAVDAVLYSVPAVVGSGITDSSGAARFAVTFPASLAAGSHTLVVSGFAPGGSAAFAALAVTVPGARQALAYSGATPNDVLPLAGIMFVLVGGALLAATRRARATGR